MSDFKIGDDARRRAPPTSWNGCEDANRGAVAWDTEAPADFTYLYDPDHVLVRADDTDAAEGALRRIQRGFERRMLGRPCGLRS